MKLQNVLKRHGVGGGYKKGSLIELDRLGIIPPAHILDTISIAGDYVYDVAVDKNFNIYSITFNNKLRKYDIEGNLLWTKTIDRTPKKLIVDKDSIYICAYTVIIKFDLSGVELKRISVSKMSCYGLAMDDNNLYISDDNQKLHKYSKNLTLVYSVNIGTPGRGLGLDNLGNIYLANNKLSKYTNGGAKIWDNINVSIPYEVCVDSNGDAYCGGNNRTIYKVSPENNLIWSFVVPNGTTNKVVTGIEADNKTNIYTIVEDGTVSKISNEGIGIKTSIINTNARTLGLDTDNFVYIGFQDGFISKVSYDSAKLK